MLEVPAVGAVLLTLIVYVVQVSQLTTVAGSHVCGVAHPYQLDVFVNTWSVLHQLGTAFIAISQLHNKLVLFIVFILVQLTNVSCFL